MESAYWHLATNHIPIVGVPLALVVLAIGYWLGSERLKATAYLIFVFLGLATIAVYFLGHGGEDFVEALPSVSHDTIEEHEEFALFPLVSVLIASALSLVGLLGYGGLSTLLKRNDDTDTSSSPAWLSLSVLGVGLIAAATLGYMAYLGGAIRHPEFHGGTTAAATTNESHSEEENGEDSGRGRGRNRGRE